MSDKENQEIHKIFNGANEDDFTKKSRKAIRENLIEGYEDKEEELNKEEREI